jgi:hypothetical protein
MAVVSIHVSLEWDGYTLIMPMCTIRFALLPGVSQLRPRRAVPTTDSFLYHISSFQVAGVPFLSSYDVHSQSIVMAAFESRFRGFQQWSTHLMYGRRALSTLCLLCPSSLVTASLRSSQREHLNVTRSSHMSTTQHRRALPGAPLTSSSSPGTCR